MNTKKRVSSLVMGKPRSLPGGLNRKVRQQYKSEKGVTTKTPAFIREFQLASRRTKRRIDFIAIAALRTSGDIKQFFAWYKGYTAQQLAKEKNTDNPLEVARSNIGYILGYFGQATQKRWYAALKDVSHPVFGYDFGRSRGVSTTEALSRGLLHGKRVKEDYDRRN